jgi:hypothetical protein
MIRSMVLKGAGWGMMVVGLSHLVRDRSITTAFYVALCAVFLGAVFIVIGNRKTPSKNGGDHAR